MEDYADLLNINKLTWRIFDSIVYEYLESNKDAICEYYQIKYFNPTEMKKALIKYIKNYEYNKLEPLVYNSGEPVYLDYFLKLLKQTNHPLVC